MGLVKKIGVGLAGLVVLVIVGGLGFVWWIGAWNILFPSRDHGSTPPAIAGDFGEGFIELARAVYHRNDRRAALKREINLLLGSAIVEEKSYASY